MGKGLEQTLLQGGHTEGPETYERCSASLTIREMQIKTTMRYQRDTLVRMAIINKSTSNNQQMLERLWRKGNPSALLVGMQAGAATVENSMEFPQKSKNGSAF